jgi:hypothetical protein
MQFVVLLIRLCVSNALLLLRAIADREIGVSAAWQGRVI